MIQIGQALREKFAGSDRAYEAMNEAMWRFERRADFSGVNDEEAAAIKRRALSMIQHGWGMCESPIEKIMLPALVFADYGHHYDLTAYVAVEERAQLAPSVIQIVPQFEAPGARFDFAVIARRAFDCGFVARRVFAVECDGVAFHDVRKDSRRDALFAGLGVTTIREQGAVITATPEAVAERVAREIIGWAK
jgi:hypothetical protein